MTQNPHHEVELYDDDGRYRVFVDAPGFDRDDIDVRWHDNRLSVSAERSDSGATSARVFHHEVSVPATVRADDISARYRDGVLDVELPVDERTNPPGRRIDVQE